MGYLSASHHRPCVSNGAHFSESSSGLTSTRTSLTSINRLGTSCLITRHSWWAALILRRGLTSSVRSTCRLTHAQIRGGHFMGRETYCEIWTHSPNTRRMANEHLVNSVFIGYFIHGVFHLLKKNEPIENWITFANQMIQGHSDLWHDFFSFPRMWFCEFLDALVGYFHTILQDHPSNNNASNAISNGESTLCASNSTNNHLSIIRQNIVGK